MQSPHSRLLKISSIPFIWSTRTVVFHLAYISHANRTTKSHSNSLHTIAINGRTLFMPISSDFSRFICGRVFQKIKHSNSVQIAHKTPIKMSCEESFFYAGDFIYAGAARQSQQFNGAHCHSWHFYWIFEILMWTVSSQAFRLFLHQ